MEINFIHIPKNGGTSIKDICNKQIIYNGHETDVYNENLINQLVIIRNPIDRFISSVNYAIQEWSHETQINYLISKNIDTPEKWVNIWSNPAHKEHNNLMSEMINQSHFIGDKFNKYKWTYSPQSLWVNNPKFVIIMDNFNDEIKYLMKKYNIEANISQKNSTVHKDHKLSEESVNFLKKIYKEDFILYEKYKNISLEKRINLTF